MIMIMKKPYKPSKVVSPIRPTYQTPNKPTTFRSSNIDKPTLNKPTYQTPNKPTYQTPNKPSVYNKSYEKSRTLGKSSITKSMYKSTKPMYKATFEKTPKQNVYEKPKTNTYTNQNTAKQIVFKHQNISKPYNPSKYRDSNTTKSFARTVSTTNELLSKLRIFKPTYQTPNKPTYQTPNKPRYEGKTPIKRIPFLNFNLLKDVKYKGGLLQKAIKVFDSTSKLNSHKKKISKIDQITEHAQNLLQEDFFGKIYPHTLEKFGNEIRRYLTEKQRRKSLAHLIFRASHSNFFLTVVHNTDHKVLNCITAGNSKVGDSIKQKTSPYAMEQISRRLKITLIKYKILYLIIYILTNPTTAFFTLIHQLQQNCRNVRIVKLVENVRIPHNGVRGRNVRRK